MSFLKELWKFLKKSENLVSANYSRDVITWSFVNICSRISGSTIYLYIILVNDDENHIVINILLIVGTILLLWASIYLTYNYYCNCFIFFLLFYFLSKIKIIRVVSINLLILFISLFAIESFLKFADAYKEYKKRSKQQIFTVMDRDTGQEINESKSYQNLA